MGRLRDIESRDMNFQNARSLEEFNSPRQRITFAHPVVKASRRSQYQQRVEAAEAKYWTEAARLSRQLLGPMKAELREPPFY